MEKKVQEVGPNLLKDEQALQARQLADRQQRSKTFAPVVVFILLMLGVFGAIAAIKVFKDNVGEVFRWIRTGSTVLVESPPADLQN